MGILKDAILAAIQQEHPDAHWVGNEKPHMIESTAQAKMFDNRTHGDIDMSNAYRKLTGKRGFFNQCYLYEDKICNTLTAHADSTIPFNKPVYLSKSEVCNASTFPQDYDFCGFSPHYICGMSVPPVMMAQVATRVYEQWLSKL